MPKFTKGDKIKCVNDKHASGGLIEGEVYTAKHDSSITDGWQETVPVEEIPGWAFQIDRFEKVQPEIIFSPDGIAVGREVKDYPPGGAEEPRLEPGDWVRATGQVIKADGPGDTLVEFFSHNEQWSGWIENKRVMKTAVPAWAAQEQCTALTVNVLDTNVLYRCEKPEHRRFDKEHKSGQYTWADGDNSGFFEEA